MLSSTVPCRHVALKDPGKSIGCINPVPSPMTLAFAPGLMGSALSTSHAPILLWGNQISGLYYGSHSLRPADLLASLVGADQRFPQPTETFTSGLPADWSPAPPPNMTTVATGKFHRRDFHPLERRLASLQQALRFARLPDRSYRCRLSPQGSRGFYIRAEHASLPPHASDMLTTRPGNWWCGDLHPTRFTALSAAPV